MRTTLSILMVLLLGAAAIGWVGCESGDDLTGPEYGMRNQAMEPGRLTAVDRFSSRSGRFDPGPPFPGRGGMGGHYVETVISRDSGGTLEFWNGTLEISPGSIDATKTIWARTYSLSRGDFFKKIYEFGPSGTTFDPPAILTLSYCDLGPLLPNVIKLRVFNEETQQWEVASTMVNDPASKTFTGPIEHFSRYSLSGNGQVLRPKVE